MRKATLASLLARAASGLRLNEHLTEDGPNSLPSCLQDGTRRDRVEARGLALQFWPLAALAQEQEPRGAGREAGSRRGLGPMVIRKKERFEPVTLGHIRSHGCRDLLIYCGSINCNHSTTMNADHLPDDTVIRALGPKMVCTKCAIAAPTFGRIGHHTSISGTFRAAQAARGAGAGLIVLPCDVGVGPDFDAMQAVRSCCAG